MGTTCFAATVTYSRHVISSNQWRGQGVACLNQFSSPAGWLASSVMTPTQGPRKKTTTIKHLPLLWSARWDSLSGCVSALELCQRRRSDFRCGFYLGKIGSSARCVCAPVIIIIMHPMPVCSVSGGDIFDCIQRGNVEQCTNFIQTDRSVLKQKGMVECDMMENQ